ncbi:MAG: sugar phosphate isomerase/epimerase [Lentisphaerae bacterium]|jgi:sugar phosphate isomerase/epimerase|nr:sugar phosphate isomerase/epimerase [Lentisphaerota bacterium]
MHSFSGFADEAGNNIDVQVKATQALGWHNIEARNIDGINLTDIDDAKFDQVCVALEEANLTIDCFGTAIANWAKDPRSDEDFEKDKVSLRRALPRMSKLGTGMLRGMSYAIVRDEEPDSPEIEKQVFYKVSELVKMCEDAGVLYLHENCRNYGGLSHEHTLKLLEAVDSPSLRLVFDTGNPVFSDRKIGEPPYSKQSSWEFYEAVKPFIERVHIKDLFFVSDTDGIFPKADYQFPGEGNGDVEKITADLLASGYKGAFSIEPHLAVVFHDSAQISEEEVRFNNYVEYGKRMMDMVKKLKA